MAQGVQPHGREGQRVVGREIGKAVLVRDKDPRLPSGLGGRKAPAVLGVRRDLSGLQRKLAAQHDPQQGPARRGRSRRAFVFGGAARREERRGKPGAGRREQQRRQKTVKARRFQLSSASKAMGFGGTTVEIACL